MRKIKDLLCGTWSERMLRRVRNEWTSVVVRGEPYAADSRGNFRSPAKLVEIEKKLMDRVRRLRG